MGSACGSTLAGPGTRYQRIDERGRQGASRNVAALDPSLRSYLHLDPSLRQQADREAWRATAENEESHQRGSQSIGPAGGALVTNTEVAQCAVLLTRLVEHCRTLSRNQKSQDRSVGLNLLGDDAEEEASRLLAWLD